MLVIDAIPGPVGRSRQAVAIPGSGAAQLERARAHAAAGAALRRAGSPVEARERLRLAVDLAHRCGATALEDEALAELRAAGGRPRRRLVTGAGALTPSERRVADLAAAGRQNREIAEALVVTLDTVEYHLRNAYRKLGIAGRAGLREALGIADPPAAPSRRRAATFEIRLVTDRGSSTFRWPSQSSSQSASTRRR